MPKPRLPQSKAEVSGATLKDPGRFKDRKTPPGSRPVGNPYAAMTEPQRNCWEELKYEMPWLTSSDRVLLEMVCILTARMRSGEEFGVQAMQALSSMLSKLGATPADKTKITYDPGEEADPADEFFSRPH
jgi:hypothetical protein